MSKSSKNFIIFTLVSFILLTGYPCPANEGDPTNTTGQRWGKAAFSARELSRIINDEAWFLERYIDDDEETLQEHLNTVENELKKNNETLDKLRKELDKKQELNEQLEIEFQNASSDMKTLEGTVRASARQCIEHLKSSPVTATHQNRLKPLETFLSGKSFPSIQDVSAISKILFEEIEQTGAAVVIQSSFIGISGTEQTGTIVRAGGFFLGFDDGKNTGFLTYGEKLPTAINGLPRNFSKTIKAWLTGRNNTLCMDITHGAALEAQARKRNFFRWFEAGGLLLWPIFAIALAGLLVVLYKACYLFSRRRLSGNILNRLEQHIKEHDWQKCEELLFSTKRTPAATVLGKGIRFYKTSLDALDNSLQEASLNTMARLERLLPLLGVFTAMAPLLGLLGTVTGMIATFQTITIFGTGDPRMLSTGISEALITTQAGLGVTIPFMLIHHLLKRRVNTLMDDIEEGSAGLSALIADYQHNLKRQEKI